MSGYDISTTYPTDFVPYSKLILKELCSEVATRGVRKIHRKTQMQCKSIDWFLYERVIDR